MPKRGTDPVIDAKALDKRTDGVGAKAGEECGIVHGKHPPCGILLDTKLRCRLHCRAKTRNPESVSVLCPQWRMKGAVGCRRHGGKVPKGVLNPGYKTGRWSAYAPKRYAAMVEQVRAGDPLDLHDDIHMVSARIAELLASVDTGAGPEFVKAIDAKIGKLYADLEAKLSEPQFTLFQEVTALLKSAARDYSVWNEIQGMFSQRVKMVESQRKRDLEGGKYVTADDMISMVNAMGVALKKKLTDKLPKEEADTLLADIGAEFAAIQGIGTSQVIDGGDQ